jgi:hypothetical protein
VAVMASSFTDRATLGMNRISITGCQPMNGIVRPVAWKQLEKMF